MSRYAQETTVSVNRTRDDIERILSKHGADGFYYGNGGATSVGDPLDTVTAKDRFALCEPSMMRDGENYLLDILFRMLQPHELAAAHSFPSDYKFAGNRDDVVRQIGNSVPVRTARALGASAMRWEV